MSPLKIELKKEKMGKTIGESRLLDNHFFENIHEKSWIVQKKNQFP